MGAWIETSDVTYRQNEVKVAPYVGAWIETKPLLRCNLSSMSHPMWVRGLKRPNRRICQAQSSVAPYVGAWIETDIHGASQRMERVAPYVGAWIETSRSG